MVAAARAIGLEAYVCDGAALSYTEEFDAVFTNATLHWIKLPEAVIAGVWRALRPGGRFVGEFGGCGNVATITAAIEAALRRRDVEVVSPWYFPEPEHYAALLEEAGFAVHAIDLFARPTPLPGDARGWLETFAHVYLAAVPLRDREQLISEVVADLRDRLTDNEGNWIADYVRLRFHARKPADSGR
jgi:SAM-dependent methyltransferase